MKEALILIAKSILALVWLYANIYLIQNRKALARMQRGYGAYEAWKMRDWVASWKDFFDFDEIPENRIHGGF